MKDRKVISYLVTDQLIIEKGLFESCTINPLDNPIKITIILDFYVHFTKQRVGFGIVSTFSKY